MVTQKFEGVVERYSGEIYGRLLVGIYLTAAVVWIGATAVGYPREGFVAFIGIFVVGLVADFALRRSPVTVYDERYYEISRRASDMTFNIFGGGGFVVFVTLIALEFAGMYEMSPRAEAVFLAWAAMALTWGVAYTYLKYRM